MHARGRTATAVRCACGGQARQRTPLALLFALIVLLVAASVDMVTPPTLDVLPLYLAPAMLIAWCSRGTSALVMAALVAAVWLALNPAADGLAGWWNLAGGCSVLALATLLTVQVRRARADARLAARTDALTGVANQKGFAERAARELARARRQDYPVTLAYLDVDDFKQVNDTLGHAAGDALLQLLANTVCRHLRPYDILARLGGDEFALLLPMAGRSEADAVLARIRAALHDALGREGWPATVSIGALVCRTAPDALGALVDQADTLMYRAKRAGKNRIVIRDWSEIDVPVPDAGPAASTPTPIARRR